MKNLTNQCSSIVSFLANTVTFSLQKTLLFLVGFFILYSCAVRKETIVWVQIVSQPIKTMKGYKYYIIYNNKFDSTFQQSDKFELGKFYPFTIKK